MTCLWAASASLAVAPDTPETWDGGTTAGWSRYDTLNDSTVTLTNLTNCLKATFSGQEYSMPQVHMIQGDLNASGGSFTGCYWWAGITNVSFRLFCERLVPSDLRMCLYGAASGHRWDYPLSVSTTGQWIQYSIPVGYDKGWYLLDGTSAAFKSDLQNIGWVGIRIQRNGSIEQQEYLLDDFVVRGASPLKDADSDGASDWHEFIAGTGVDDAGSRFEVEITLTNTWKARPDAQLKWTSSGDRLYTILRSTNLVQGFVPVRTNIPGNPPKNRELDENVENNSTYYRIDVR